MTKLITFEFSGLGNFSASFGWDNGLDSSLGRVVEYDYAVEAEQCSAYNNSLVVVHLPLQPEAGLYHACNEHGGSRNVEGYVVAQTKEEAEQLLQEFDASFKVVEYEED